MKRILLSVTVIFIISACGNVNNTDMTIPLPQTTAIAPVPTPSPSERAPEPSVEATPAFDWATAEITEENVRKALEGNVGAPMAIPITDKTVRKIVANDWEENSLVFVTVNPGVFYGEKDFVKRSGGSLIAYSKILFENPKISEVAVKTMIDNVGGGENRAVDISWRRADIDGLDLSVLLENMLGDYTIPYQLAHFYLNEKDLYGALPEFGLPMHSDE